MKKLVLATVLTAVTILPMSATAGGFFGNWGQSVSNQTHPVGAVLAIPGYPAKVALAGVVGNTLSLITTGQTIHGVMDPLENGDR